MLKTELHMDTTTETVMYQADPFLFPRFWATFVILEKNKYFQILLTFMLV